MPAEELVRMTGIAKRFGDVLALDHVDFGITGGKVHALLGENGAGKTTLMNVLYGLYRADEGRIEIKGKEMAIRTPRDALRHRIAMVHQHFRLVSNFTSFENILLGTGRGLKFEARAQREKVESIAREYGLSVDLDAKVKALPVGAQQRVEILKVLARDPLVLILDEPTSSLTPQEADVLLGAIKKLAMNGLGVVFITHKVREVMSIADEITVLNGGRVAGRLQVSESGEKRLVELMMGGRGAPPLLQAGPTPARTSAAQGEPALVLASVSVGSGKGASAVEEVDLAVRHGEILGVAGVSGNGQRELAEAIMCVRRAGSGSIKLDGIELTRLNTKQVISMGVGYIPEDRMGDGILPSMTIAENIVLGREHSPSFSDRFALNRKAMGAAALRGVEDYNIKTTSVEAHAGVLSGGNVQKILIARAFLTQCKFLVAHNPTRGLDIAATDHVLRSLVKQKEGGAGVLLISEDLDELMAVSDRICVLFKGQVMGVVEAGSYDKYEIGAMMAGKKKEASAS